MGLAFKDGKVERIGGFGVREFVRVEEEGNGWVEGVELVEEGTVFLVHDYEVDVGVIEDVGYIVGFQPVIDA